MSEVSQLRTRVAELEARLAALEPKPAPPPALERYREPAVSIVNVVERGAFVMATDAQLKSLLKIVLAKFPHLALKGDVITVQDKEKYLDGFRGAFWRLGHMNRIDDQLDSSHMNGFWLDESRDWLRQYGGRFSADVSLKNWLAAIVAHGDVSYATPDAFATMQGLAFGLLAVGTGAGRRCTNAWKRLIAGEARVREPLRIPVPTEKASPVRITGG
jgi:hypothetical protein